MYLPSLFLTHLTYLLPTYSILFRDVGCCSVLFGSGHCQHCKYGDHHDDDGKKQQGQGQEYQKTPGITVSWMISPPQQQMID